MLLKKTLSSDDVEKLERLKASLAEGEWERANIVDRSNLARSVLLHLLDLVQKAGS